MKLLELHLVAFGPFTDVRLDFSTPSSGLHVIYGPNEAGKSTALRAIRGLLYGIPHITPDAHLHLNTDLRIGGRVENGRGATLRLLRRKGRVKTLRDHDDQPIEDAALAPFLGGVTEELFATTFGLNHETLREGGEALLQGKGDVGQSLFGAGLGGPGLQQLLAELQKEADEIFTAQARTRPLNEAIKAFEEANRKVKLAAKPAAEWTRKKQEIAEAEAQRARIDGDVLSLRAAEKRLRRVHRVLPLLLARRTLFAKRAALGEVVLLPESAQRDREDALQRAEDAAAQEGRLRRDVDELEARHAALHIPESLAELDAAVLDGLQSRLGGHHKAALDLPRVRAELAGLEADARALLRRLGRDVSLAAGDASERIEALRPDAATEARIQRLARDRGAVEAKPREVERLIDDRRARRAACARRLAELPPAEDPAPLRSALSRAQKLGDIEQRLREAETAAARLAREADAQRDRLGLGATEQPITAIEASALAVPLPETVERSAAQWAALTRDREKLAERTASIEAGLRESVRQLDALKRAGAVPTEDDVAAARARRDAAFRELIRTFQAEGAAPAEPRRPRGAGRPGEGRARASAPSAAFFDAGTSTTPVGSRPHARPADEEADRPRPDDYAELVREADAIADRLRREADRVARLASLLAEQARANAEHAALAEERTALAQREAEAEAAWLALWARAGVTPRSPDEMRAWLGRFTALVTTADRLRAAQAEVEAQSARIRAHAAELCATLSGVRGGVAQVVPEAGGAGLPSLIEAAERTLAAIDGAARERGELERELRDLDRKLEDLERERDEHARALAAWRDAWTASVHALGLPADASADEVMAILDLLGELFRKLDLAAHERRRVLGMERDARIFTADVAALAAERAPDLAALPVEQAADQLVKRYHKARADRRERDEVERRLAEKRRDLGEQTSRREAAEVRLARLFEAARVERTEDAQADLAALEAAEERSREVRRLERGIAENEGQLLDAGEGSGIAALEDETAGLDQGALAVELTHAEQRLAALDEERRTIDMALGSLQQEREQLRATVGAAEAAAEAQICLAHLRGEVHRYVRARLAAVLLEREIERYRERNQGPILLRASELFRRLTLGAFAGLRVSYDDHEQATLRCVRAVGPAAVPAQRSIAAEAAPAPLRREVDILGLSDGTRDQLYLALRLASLEHHGKTAEPMPLILDDILIHFDDARARAALAILGEMATTTQILFFTHHARLLELSREAVPAEARCEHRLG